MLVRRMDTWVLLNDSPQSAIAITTDAQLRDHLFHVLTADEQRRGCV